MNYQKALEQAIVYIENHLNEDIKVEDVSHVAGYSYFHFNRQFNAILGESVGNYIKKRRLANAACKLLYTDDKIIDIAIENQFESAEAFSRAFKAAYKMSPQNYRKRRIHTFMSTKKCLDNNLLKHLLNHVTVHPKIIELSEIKVIGLREKTELKNENIKKLWEKFYIFQNKVFHQYPNSRKFGIYELYNQNIHFTVNENMVFSQILGIEVTSFDNIPYNFVAKTISGGRYAVFTHRGSLKTLPQTVDYIWGTWMLSTKEEMDNRETFEIYDRRFLGYDNPNSEIDLCIAIR